MSEITSSCQERFCALCGRFARLSRCTPLGWRLKLGKVCSEQTPWCCCTCLSQVASVDSWLQSSLPTNLLISFLCIGISPHATSTMVFPYPTLQRDPFRNRPSRCVPQMLPAILPCCWSCKRRHLQLARWQGTCTSAASSVGTLWATVPKNAAWHCHEYCKRSLVLAAADFSSCVVVQFVFPLSSQNGHPSDST